MFVAGLLRLPFPLFAAILQKVSVEVFSKLHACCSSISEEVKRISYPKPLFRSNGGVSQWTLEFLFDSVIISGKSVVEIPMDLAKTMNLCWIPFSEAVFKRGGVVVAQALRVVFPSAVVTFDCLDGFASLFPLCGIKELSIIDLFGDEDVSDFLRQLQPSSLESLIIIGGDVQFTLEDVSRVSRSFEFYTDVYRPVDDVDRFFTMLMSAELTFIGYFAVFIIEEEYLLALLPLLLDRGFSENPVPDTVLYTLDLPTCALFISVSDHSDEELLLRIEVQAL